MTKRALPRKALTDDEIANGGSYYSDRDINQIISGLPDPQNVNREQFWQALENYAHWYVCIAHASARYKQPPSVQERRWKSLRTGLEDVLQRLDSLPPSAVAELEAGGELLVKKTSKLPDFEAEHIPIPPLPDVPNSGGTTIHWPVERQIPKARDTIAWLLDAVTNTEDLASRTKSETGRNRPNEPKLSFCRSLAYILEAHCGAPKLSAWTDRESGQVVGPLADFLEWCFRPLGIRDSTAALEKTYRRANRT